MVFLLIFFDCFLPSPPSVLLSSSSRSMELHCEQGDAAVDDDAASPNLPGDTSTIGPAHCLATAPWDPFIVCKEESTRERTKRLFRLSLNQSVIYTRMCNSRPIKRTCGPVAAHKFRSKKLEHIRNGSSGESQSESSPRNRLEHSLHFMELSQPV